MTELIPEGQTANCADDSVLDTSKCHCHKEEGTHFFSRWKRRMGWSAGRLNMIHSNVGLYQSTAVFPSTPGSWGIKCSLTVSSTGELEYNL